MREKFLEMFPFITNIPICCYIISLKIFTNVSMDFSSFCENLYFFIVTNFIYLDIFLLLSGEEGSTNIGYLLNDTKVCFLHISHCFLSLFH